MFTPHLFTLLNNAFELPVHILHWAPPLLCPLHSLTSPHWWVSVFLNGFTIWPQAPSSCTPSDNTCQRNNVSCATLTKAACCAEIMKHRAAAWRAKGANTLVEGLQSSSIKSARRRSPPAATLIPTRLNGFRRQRARQLATNWTR